MSATAPTPLREHGGLLENVDVDLDKRESAVVAILRFHVMDVVEQRARAQFDNVTTLGQGRRIFYDGLVDEISSVIPVLNHNNHDVDAATRRFDAAGGGRLLISCELIA